MGDHLKVGAHDGAVLAVEVHLAVEHRQFGALLLRLEQLLEVAEGNLDRLRGQCLGERLAHRLLGSQTADLLDRRADIGDGGVHRHGPDDFPGVFGHQPVSFLRQLQLDLRLAQLGDVARGALQDHRAVLTLPRPGPDSARPLVAVAVPPDQFHRGLAARGQRERLSQPLRGSRVDPAQHGRRVGECLARRHPDLAFQRIVDELESQIRLHPQDEEHQRAVVGQAAEPLAVGRCTLAHRTPVCWRRIGEE